MSFNEPNQILPYFHHLMRFDGSKNLISRDMSAEKSYDSTPNIQKLKDM